MWHCTVALQRGKQKIVARGNAFKNIGARARVVRIWIGELAKGGSAEVGLSVDRYGLIDGFATSIRAPTLTLAGRTTDGQRCANKGKEEGGKKKADVSTAAAAANG